MAESRPRVGVVVVAAGEARRMAGLEKMVLPIAGLPVVAHSVRTFEECESVDEIVVVTRRELHDRFRTLFERLAISKLTKIVEGGATRTESSRHGMAALSPSTEVVLVHDGARPLVPADVVLRVIEAASESGAAVPAVAPVSTIRTVHEGRVQLVDREIVREIQTPQGFRRTTLAKAFAAAIRDRFDGTDDAALVERLGHEVALVEGDRKNLKITVPQDLAVAEALLSGARPAQQTRVGFGFDVHRLTPGRPFILGGVTIDHETGLDGHSDADVLSHAICDALLGAANRGDLGVHFPDTSTDWKDVAGSELLARTVEILREVGYVPINVDATVAAQAPRLNPHRDEMVANLSVALALPESAVSVKFTTTERLGFEGREEGVSAFATVLVGTIPLVAESA